MIFLSLQQFHMTCYTTLGNSQKSFIKNLKQSIFPLSSSGFSSARKQRNRIKIKHCVISEALYKLMVARKCWCLEHCQWYGTIGHTLANASWEISHLRNQREVDSSEEVDDYHVTSCNQMGSILSYIQIETKPVCLTWIICELRCRYLW